MLAASEHPQVLKEPAPDVVFTDFGADALMFELRVLGKLAGDQQGRGGKRPAVRIDELFADRGIVLAYPQRDVHLNVLRPVEVRLDPAADRQPHESRPDVSGAMSRKPRRKAPRRDITIHRRTRAGSVARPGPAPIRRSPQPTIHVMAFGSNGVVDRDVADAGRGPRPGRPAAADLDQRRRAGRRADASSNSASCLTCTAWPWKTRSTSTSGPRSRTTARCCSSCCGWCIAATERLLRTEQLSMFVGPNWVLTFQEGHPGDRFDRVRARIREGAAASGSSAATTWPMP